MKIWLGIATVLGLLAQPATRSLNDINWMEFQELIPSKIETILIPVGTMEAHGVINNGADNTAPEAIVKEIAAPLNAVYAPVLPYGVTGALAPYAGSFSIKESHYRAFVTDVLEGWAGHGFKNLIIVNGHGGPQTAILESIATDVGSRLRVRVMVINWWALASDLTKEIFGEDGGHAGWNETAYVQAVNPKLVDARRYSKELATARPAANTWFAYPFPSSIILYQPNQGYVRFDRDKAEQYRKAVNQRMQTLIGETIGKWDKAKIFRD
ncbi:MAG: creatininase family protein [Acidobacteria bacterium]|nr:creatininase family protein [Acidobacteriota bacterium]